jgi:hypothetical protein
VTQKFNYQIAGGILESLWYGNTWKLSHGWQTEKNQNNFIFRYGFIIQSFLKC